jgi:hypothetical protein
MKPIVLVPVVSAIAAFAGLCAPLTADSAEKFQKLSGSQIRAKFTGMEMTDNTHWADVFGSNGSLTSYSMGKKKDGKWRIEKDDLCLERGQDESGCYQVWLSGKNVEFRREGLPTAFEGVLQRPSARK